MYYEDYRRYFREFAKHTSANFLPFYILYYVVLIAVPVVCFVATNRCLHRGVVAWLVAIIAAWL